MRQTNKQLNGFNFQNKCNKQINSVQFAVPKTQNVTLIVWGAKCYLNILFVCVQTGVNWNCSYENVACNR